MKELIRRLSSNKIFLTEILFSSLFVNILALATPIFVIQVLQRYVAYAVTSTLITLVVGIIIIIIFEFFFRNIRHSISGEFEAMNASLSNQIYSKIHSIPTAFFILKDIRLEKLKRNVQLVASNLNGSTLLTFIDAPFSIIFLLAVYLLHYQLGIILTLFLAIPFILSRIFNKEISKKRQESSNEVIKQSVMISDAVSKNLTFKFFSLINLAIASWKQNLLKLTNQKGIFENKRNYFSSMLMSVSLILTVAIIGWGAVLTVDGELSVGALNGANILASRAIAPIIKYVQIQPVFNEVDSMVSELKEIMSLPNEQIQGNKIENYKGFLSVKNLSLTYPNSRNPIFEDIDFDTGEGKILCIKGNNGAGKTSLIKLITGILPYTRGQVFFDGIEIRQISVNWVRDNISYMPQIPDFIDATLWHNITAGKEIEKKLLENILEDSDLSEFINQHPQGIMMGINNNQIQLPLGIIKRIAFARALFSLRKIFILDEPTEGLDEKGTIKIIDKITKLKKSGKTIVIASSEEKLINIADKVIDL